MPESTPPETPTRADSRAADVAATRRQLFGIGVASVIGLGGAAAGIAAVSQSAPAGGGANTALAGGTERRLATPSPTRPSTATPAPSLTPAPPAVPKRDFAAPPPVSRRPGAVGGPADRDSSASSSVAGLPELPPGRQYTGFAAAAAAANPVASAIFSGSDASAHLLRRATFGPRPTDRADLASAGIDGWLSSQLSPASVADPEGDAAWSVFPLAGASPAQVNGAIEKYRWDAVYQTAQATLGRQLFSGRQLYEVVVDVFADHLHVPLPSEQWNTGSDYIAQVIRANAFGTYREMLLAAMRHPAMLDYLDNDDSRKEHVNENLGRELLELHTVGIAGGYTEDDVLASARILTGRTVDHDAGTFRWDANRHYTGPLTVLGFTDANPSADGGLGVGDRYLTYLAEHPATARTIARKLAVRFIADRPSDDLVQRLADVYLASGTSILETVKAVFLSSDFWSAIGLRMRRPLEDAVGAARVLEVSRGDKTREAIESLYWALHESGHTPLGWPPPNGYPDVAAAWLSGGGQLQRWNMHRSLVHGWRKGFSYVKPADLVPAAGTTAGAWIDALALRVLGGALAADHRATLLAFAGAAADAPAGTIADQAGEIVALLLDSAYFQLR